MPEDECHLLSTLEGIPRQLFRRQIAAVSWMGPFAAAAESNGDEPGVLPVLHCPGGML